MNLSLSLGSSPVLTPHSPLKFKSTFKAQLKYQLCPKSRGSAKSELTTHSSMLLQWQLCEKGKGFHSLLTICGTVSYLSLQGFLHPPLSYGRLAGLTLVSALALASVRVHQ